MSELIGKELGPYRILEQIGTGGMATVYKAYHPATDRYVAVKILSEQMSGDNELRKRFQRECKVIAKLEHARILPVYDYGHAGDRLYLVTRYIEAGTLKERLAQGPMNLSHVSRTIGQVGEALAYAHRMGVVHRDVKPSNVLLDAEGDCYLTDFGLARILEASARLTATGVGVGTPAYMSPEQGQGEKVDERSDVYSLGVMLYEMATGQVPYQAETPLAVVLKHITAPLPLPREVKPDIPEAVERVILKAMAKNPDDRFQAVGEMVAALDAAVRLAQAEMPTEMAVPEPAPAEGVTPQRKGRLARTAARVREAAGTKWGKMAMWATVPIVALLILYLVLSHVPLQVQIRDGQLEVVRIVEATVTPEVSETATGMVTPAPPIPSEVPQTPVQTPMPTPTRATPTPTRVPPSTPTPATLSPSVAALQWEQLTDADGFVPTALHAMAVDPNHSDTVYAGTYGAGIYVSRDGGRTWIPSNQGLGKGTIGSIVVDPNDSDVVYTALFDQGGVYKSTDGGRIWEAANAGINLDRAWDWGALVYVDPADSQRLYYSGGSNGLYLSVDGGQNWTRQGGDCPMIVDFVVDPADFGHLYVGSHAHAGSGCQAGVLETTDGGWTWERLTQEERVTPGESGEETWHVAVDPHDFATIYASDQSVTLKSSDRGRTWTQILGDSCQWLMSSPESSAVYCGQGGQIRISHDGGMSWSIVALSGRSEWSIKPFAIAPSAPQTLYAGSNMALRSDDGGETWLSVGRLGAAHVQLTVDPRDGNRLFLGGRHGWCETHRSEDGGRTWQVIASEAGGCTVVVDSAQDIIYRPSRSQGLLYSQDNGQTWEQLGGGYHEPWLVVVDPQDSRKLWITEGCSMRPLLSRDGGLTFAEVESFPNEVCGDPILLVHPKGERVYVEDNGAIHRSDDGGGTWRRMAALGGMYRAAALDPSDPDVLYLGSTHKGIFKTTSGGSAWSQANDGLTNFSINEIVIDPGNPQIIYVATDGRAFVSMDGGEQWWPIQGGLGPNPIVYSIAMDPNDSSKVYAATPDGIYRLVGAPPGVTVAKPMPTPSTAEVARAFAEPILSTIAERHPDYEDSFGDPGSGWPMGSTAAGDAWGYEDGAFFISLTPLYADADGDCALNLSSERAPWVSDFVLEVDAEFVAGEQGHWDVGFRQSESGASSYWMNLLPSGAFALHKTVNGDGVSLVQYQDLSILKQRFGTTNHLTIIAQGPRIVVYVNGELLCSAYDESLSEGRITLGVFNRADTPLWVHFDNLRIWDIADLPLPSDEASECRIVYAQDGDTYVRNCDGSGEQRLTDGPAEDWSPSWSPDGTQIVFTSDRDATHAEGYQLYVMNADGSDPSMLTTHTDRNAKSASWSPDGRRIAFHSYCELVVMDADGTSWTVLVEGEEGLCPDFPTWSPDGRRIAFRNMTLPDNGPPVKHDIYVVNSDGSGLLKLTSLTSEDWSWYAVWSPDGRQVAFDVLVDGQERYYAVDADGSGEPVEISSIPDSWYPWTYPQWGGETGVAPTPVSGSSADQARAFAEPILTAIADRSPDYGDDFGDPSGGWTTVQDTQGETGYEDGEYFVAVSVANDSNFGFSASLPELSDFVLELDGRFASGNDGHWAVVCGGATEKSGGYGRYDVNVFASGEVRISRCMPDCMELTQVYGSFVHPGYSTNHLQIIVRKPHIALSVNGEWVSLIADPYDTTQFRFDKGRIELGARSANNTPVRVYFDNLKVWDISDLELPSAEATPTPSPEHTPSPKPAPVGRHVWDDRGDLYVVNSDGSGERRLTDDPAHNREVDWSPDGTQLVFTSDRDAAHELNFQLYVVGIDGSNLRRLTHTDRNDVQPSWSPDGDRIVFASSGDLVVINADGSNWVTLVEERPGLPVMDPSWSPDSHRIAFTIQTPVGGPPPVRLDIYAVNDDGSGLLRLATFTSEEGTQAVWSPDGRQVAFAVLVDGQERYYAVDADGSGEPVEISSIPDSWYPWYYPQWGGETGVAPTLTPGSPAD